MTIQTINLGSYANDGTGDDLRTAFEKVNSNFSELGGSTNIINGSNVGTGTGVFAQRNVATLEFKTITSEDNSVTITNTPTTVNLKATASVQEDPHPTLGADLNLNEHVVWGGDVQTTIFGVSVPILAGIMDLLIASNQLNIDLGTVVNPTGSTGELGNGGTVLDMGYINTPYDKNNLNFGEF